MLGLSGIVTAYCDPVSFPPSGGAASMPRSSANIRSSDPPARSSHHRRDARPAADFILHLPWEKHAFHLDYLTTMIGAL